MNNVQMVRVKVGTRKYAPTSRGSFQTMDGAVTFHDKYAIWIFDDTSKNGYTCRQWSTGAFCSITYIYFANNLKRALAILFAEIF